MLYHYYYRLRFVCRRRIIPLPQTRTARKKIAKASNLNTVNVPPIGTERLLVLCYCDLRFSSYWNGKHYWNSYCDFFRPCEIGDKSAKARRNFKDWNHIRTRLLKPLLWFFRLCEIGDKSAKERYRRRRLDRFWKSLWFSFPLSVKKQVETIKGSYELFDSFVARWRSRRSPLLRALRLHLRHRHVQYRYFRVRWYRSSAKCTCGSQAIADLFQPSENDRLLPPARKE